MCFLHLQMSAPGSTFLGTLASEAWEQQRVRLNEGGHFVNLRKFRKWGGPNKLAEVGVLWVSQALQCRRKALHLFSSDATAMHHSKAAWSSINSFAKELHVVCDLASSWPVPSLSQSQEATAIRGLYAAADGTISQSQPVGANQA